MKKMSSYILQLAYCHAISNGADKFEVKHFDNTFIVDLVRKECSCRYWQLSGLPCSQAISSIYYKTNTLDDYIAKCYSIKHFRETYAYCLEPVQGMDGWPQSDRPKMKPPGYIRMPGRPKTERRMEAGEKPKATNMSRVGTIIRCRKCKAVGHNISTCGKRTATSAQSQRSGNFASETQSQNPRSGNVASHSQDPNQRSRNVTGHTQSQNQRSGNIACHPESQNHRSDNIASYSGDPNAMVVLLATQHSSNNRKRRSSSIHDSMTTLPTSERVCCFLCSFRPIFALYGLLILISLLRVHVLLTTW